MPIPAPRTCRHQPSVVMRVTRSPHPNRPHSVGSDRRRASFFGGRARTRALLRAKVCSHTGAEHRTSALAAFDAPSGLPDVTDDRRKLDRSTRRSKTECERLVWPQRKTIDDGIQSTCHRATVRIAAALLNIKSSKRIGAMAEPAAVGAVPLGVGRLGVWFRGFVLRDVCVGSLGDVSMVTADQMPEGGLPVCPVAVGRLSESSSVRTPPGSEKTRTSTNLPPRYLPLISGRLCLPQIQGDCNFLACASVYLVESVSPSLISVSSLACLPRTPCSLPAQRVERRASSPARRSPLTGVKADNDQSAALRRAPEPESNTRGARYTYRQTVKIRPS